MGTTNSVPIAANVPISYDDPVTQLRIFCVNNWKALDVAKKGLTQSELLIVLNDLFDYVEPFVSVGIVVHKKDTVETWVNKLGSYGKTIVTEAEFGAFIDDLIVQAGANKPTNFKVSSIVFVNPSAGGGQGIQVAKKMRKLLGDDHVFDLKADSGPGVGLDKWKSWPNLRIICAGGDGTIVVPLPLGTGNDTSRAMMWGPGYNGEKLKPLLEKIERASIMKFDRWAVKAVELTEAEVADLKKRLAAEETIESSESSSLEDEDAKGEEKDTKKGKETEKQEEKKEKHEESGKNYKSPKEKNDDEKQENENGEKHERRKTDEGEKEEKKQEDGVKKEKNKKDSAEKKDAGEKKEKRENGVKKEKGKKTDDGEKREEDKKIEKKEKSSVGKTEKAKEDKQTAKEAKETLAKIEVADIQFSSPRPPRPSISAPRSIPLIEAIEVGSDKDKDLGEKETPPDEKEKEKSKKKTVGSKEFVANNYFSIGIDSKMLYEFDQMRKKHPQLFPHRTVNFGWYGLIGMKNMVVPYKEMRGICKLWIDGVEKKLPKSLQCIVMLNVPSYSGGTNPWDNPGDAKRLPDIFPQSLNDGVIEVFGMRGASHLGRAVAHISRGGHRLGQGKVVKILTLEPVAGQVDGEPYFFGPSKFKFDRLCQVNMLFNAAKDQNGKIRDRLSVLEVEETAVPVEKK